MGADGGIRIWRDEKVRAVFPDCDELFAYIPTHYCNELDGVKYHHCYSGDGLYVMWSAEEDWFPHPKYEKDPNKKRALGERFVRLREFVEWLLRNGTYWEVWT